MQQLTCFIWYIYWIWIHWIKIHSREYTFSNIWQISFLSCIPNIHIFSFQNISLYYLYVVYKIDTLWAYFPIMILCKNYKKYLLTAIISAIYVKWPFGFFKYRYSFSWKILRLARNSMWYHYMAHTNWSCICSCSQMTLCKRITQKQSSNWLIHL